MFGILKKRPQKAAAGFVVKPLVMACVIAPGTLFADQGSYLEELVVTATKRETSLQDTAMSITAFGEQELQRQGTETLADYATRIPNVGLAQGASFGRFNSSSPAIRGVPTTLLAPGSTGFYIDDISVPAYMNPRVSDIARIEVLRGPQGTLYGSRSMGGTVRVITKQANADEFEAFIHSSVSDVKEGDYNWQLDGAANVPLIEGVLGARFLGYYAENSGIFDRQFLAGSPGPAFGESEDIDDEEYYGGQLALVWHVNDNVTVKPRVMYQKSESDSLGLADLEEGNFTQFRANNIDEPGESEWLLGSLTFEIDTRFGQIVSTTAGYDREVEETEDISEAVDFFLFQAPPAFGGLGLPSGPVLPARVLTQIDDKAITHETRLVSDFGELLHEDLALTIGVFYEDNENEISNPIDQFPDNYSPGLNAAFTNTLNGFLPPFMQVPLPPGVFGTDLLAAATTTTETTNLAVFGEVIWRIQDNLRLTLGARWSDSEVDFSVQGDGIFEGGPFVVPKRTTDETRVTPKVSLEYDLNEDILLYAIYSEGFRTGGSNRPVPPVPCAADLALLGISADAGRDYETDELTNYEIGVKSSWFDNRVNVNISAFHIEWDDIIQAVSLPTCGATLTLNAGDAENQGFELEIQAAPIEGLILSLGLGITDATFTEGEALAGTSKGDRILQVPKRTLTTSAEYTFSLVDNWEAYVRGDFSYYGDSLSRVNVLDPGAPARMRDSFETLNLRIGAFQDDGWDVSLFVKNATNEEANLSDNRGLAVEMPGRQRVVTNRPRTVGVEVRKVF